MVGYLERHFYLQETDQGMLGFTGVLAAIIVRQVSEAAENWVDHSRFPRSFSAVSTCTSMIRPTAACVT
jgi:hypothetical protein